MSEENDLVFRDVYSQNGGDYDLTIGFISGDNRLICVGVNGRTVETVEAMGSGWSQISEKSLKIRLNKGNNTIRLSNATAWLPDIDYIDIKNGTSAK